MQKIVNKHCEKKALKNEVSYHSCSKLYVDNENPNHSQPPPNHYNLATSMFHVTACSSDPRTYGCAQDHFDVELEDTNTAALKDLLCYLKKGDKLPF